MKANYGYSDGSGDHFIRIDTGLCNGCGDCVSACPSGVLAVGDDGNDPLGDARVAFVVPGHIRSLACDCASCKAAGARLALPCVAACALGAIAHSW